MYEAALCVWVKGLVVFTVCLCMRSRCFFGYGGVVCKCKRRHYMYKSPLCACTAFCGACTRRHLGVNVKGAAVCIITSLCVYGVVVLCV